MDPTCLLCKQSNESLAHLQCACPATQRARIAAHHAIWASLVGELRARVPASQCVILTEITLSSLHRMGEALPVRKLIRKDWQNAVAHLVGADLSGRDRQAPGPLPLESSMSQPQFGTPSHLAMGGQGLTPPTALRKRLREVEAPVCGSSAELSQRLSLDRRVRGSRAQSAPPSDVQVTPVTSRGGTKRKREAPQAPTPSEPPLSQEEREFEPNSLAHQRPDGLWVNWHTRTFAILEFTRAYDSNTAALRAASEAKEKRYLQLLSKLQDHLPDWTGLFIPFTMGIRSTFCEKEWEDSLKQLGVPVSGHNQLFQTVVSTTFSS